jgi:hypothetical protein
MGLCRCIQMFFNAAYCFLPLFALDLRPLLIVGIFKLIAFLVLACLLPFVVVHSANIYRLVVACLRAFPMSFFPLRVDRRRADLSQTTVAVLNEPSLSPLFQRPPPILSL